MQISVLLQIIKFLKCDAIILHFSVQIKEICWTASKNLISKCINYTNEIENTSLNKCIPHSLINQKNVVGISYVMRKRKRIFQNFYCLKLLLFFNPMFLLLYCIFAKKNKKTNINFRIMLFC